METMLKKIVEYDYERVRFADIRIANCTFVLMFLANIVRLHSKSHWKSVIISLVMLRAEELKKNTM